MDFTLFEHDESPPSEPMSHGSELLRLFSLFNIQGVYEFEWVHEEIGQRGRVKNRENSFGRTYFEIVATDATQNHRHSFHRN